MKSFLRLVSLSCGHSIKRKQLIESWAQDENIVDIPSCLICGSPVPYIGRAFLDDLTNFLMYKKEAVIKVFEEYFVLKSNLEQKKKELVVKSKLTYLALGNCLYYSDYNTFYICNCY